MTDDSACTCKVGRVADEYGIEGLREEVRRLHGEGYSLRDLAREVNVRITGAVLADLDATVVGDGAAVYDVLADDAADPERRVAIRNQLRDAGVDIEELEADYLTYQAVRYHLRTCLGVDTGRSGIETVAEGRTSIAKTRERARETVANTLRRLARVDAIDAGDVSVSLSVRVRCEDCGTSETVDAFLDSGGCDCDE